MKQNIDKAAVMAEIKRMRDKALPNNNWKHGYFTACENILSFLDTIEIKEVDLEEEMRKWQQKHFEGIGYVLDGSGGWIGRTSLLDIAEHFFELGLKTQKGE